ncbi:piggyBac transposable element-derived protein 2-like isoform X2 [Myzus persicae]|uniref:piggyBac transposable element-derived protein 2-like isoform X2 n=1 Tax=Myzus persicae TaxID=13164 RepID=UPI000B934310|nr:piggyBac transposable element-derived protein 2-like isoform X2 [Myzus persicae]
MNRNILNDEELLELLYNTNWSDSEDGLDVSDNEQDHHVLNIHENVGIPTYDNDEGNLDLLDLPIEIQCNSGETIHLPSVSTSNLTNQNQFNVVNSTPRRSVRHVSTSPLVNNSRASTNESSNPKQTDTQGYAYRFEIYSGQENNSIFRHPDEPDFGASSNVVVRLSRNVPVNKNHIILGTVRINRLPNCPLPDKNGEKKMKRGESIEYITSYESTPISAVTWKDNKAVKLLSTYCGENPKSKMTRFDRSKKTNTEIDCPMLISEYNKHMGGVDLLDSHIGRYKIRFRSRKWYMRLFYHLIDLSVVNSWLLFKRVKEQQNEKPEIELPDWRKQLACGLVKSGQIRVSGRGRPTTSLEVKIASTRPQSFRPTKDVRTDKTDHWPQFSDKRERCKMPSCKGFTYIKCSKCTIYLCLNRNNNCFTNYHNM